MHKNRRKQGIQCTSGRGKKKGVGDGNMEQEDNEEAQRQAEREQEREQWLQDMHRSKRARLEQNTLQQGRHQLEYEQR